ncbi:MAG: molybdenum cofactor guanylyltransferase [Nitrospirae bacterium]|nr:MAG: molybdenum cofactor guanylyltransferase [Nitrospirota bacterium]
MSIQTARMTGILLAGGKSRRMGEDKRFLKLDGQTLLERTLAVLETLFTDIVVVVAEPLPQLAAGAHRVVVDLIPHCATLGGLYTGLSVAQYPRSFVCACDMPLLNPAVIEHMAGLDQSADVVMAQLANGLQPMHAIYSKACAPFLERMAKANNLKVQEISLVPGLSVRLVPESELLDLDPRLLSFLNINTPADLEFARKLLAGRGAPHRGTA